MLGIVFTFIAQLAIVLIITPIKFILRSLKQINTIAYKRTLKKHAQESQVLYIRTRELTLMGYNKEAKREIQQHKLKQQLQKTLYTLKRIGIASALALTTATQWLLVTFSVFFGMIIALLMTAALVTSVILPAYVQLTSTEEVAEKPKKPADKKPEEPSKEVDTSDMASLAVLVFADMALEEMGNQNSGHVSVPLNDGAGKNYGKYSFTQTWEIAPPGGGGYMPWLKKQYPELAKELSAPPASAEFDVQWRNLGATQDKKFTEAQAMYLVEKFKGHAARLNTRTGVDINNGQYTVGVWSIFASMMNQRPAWLDEVWIPYLVNNKDATPDEIIKNTAGYLKVNYNGNYAESIRNRYGRQEEKALKMKDKVKF